jgi:type I restriction enzyme R subunit
VRRAYVNQYAFLSQVISCVDPELEKFYLFTKLVMNYMPPGRTVLPHEILSMVDMDKFRVQEQENGSILLNTEDSIMGNTVSDGHLAMALLMSICCR